jgi:hypothetical protein
MSASSDRKTEASRSCCSRCLAISSTVPPVYARPAKPLQNGLYTGAGRDACLQAPVMPAARIMVGDLSCDHAELCRHCHASAILDGFAQQAAECWHDTSPMRDQT